MNIRAKYQKYTMPKGVAKLILIDKLTFSSNYFKKTSLFLVGFEIRDFSGVPAYQSGLLAAKKFS